MGILLDRKFSRDIVKTIEYVLLWDQIFAKRRLDLFHRLKSKLPPSSSRALQASFSLMS